MKHFIFILILVVCCSCQNGNQNKIEVDTKLNNTTISSFNKEMDSLYNTGIFNGYSTAIVNSNGILYNKGYGYADVSKKKKYTEHTVINIASISKVFIGVALLKAQEMDLINLDDPINKHLPFKVINPHRNVPITLRHLATHTSGIKDGKVYDQKSVVIEELEFFKENDYSKETQKELNGYVGNEWMSMEEYLSAFLVKGGKWYKKKNFFDRDSGEEWYYSNIGATLAAYIVERIAQKPYDKFVQDEFSEALVQRPNEFTVDVSYALRLSDQFGMSVAMRYLRSDLKLNGFG